MISRRFGKSDIEVSALGLGCYAIGGPFRVENGKPWGWSKVDDKESIRAIQAGMSMGVNFLDTAQAYGCGHSEIVIGKAIKARRSEVILATKFGKVIDEQNKQVLGSSTNPEDVRRSCEDSLRRFDTDYIDLFQWHESDGSVDELPGLLNTLEELVQAGKIRWYGWSTDDPERFKYLAKSPHCLAAQHRIHVFEPPTRWRQMLAICDRYDLVSIARGPLMMGLLSGKFKADTTFPQDDVRHSLDFDFSQGRLAELIKSVEDIRDVLTSDGRTMVQGALAWIWASSSRTIPIPGFKTVKQVKENAKAMEHGPLSDEQMRQIDEILGR